MKKNNLVVAALAAWILTATKPISGKKEHIPLVWSKTNNEK